MPSLQSSYQIWCEIRVLINTTSVLKHEKVKNEKNLKFQVNLTLVWTPPFIQKRHGQNISHLSPTTGCCIKYVKWNAQHVRKKSGILELLNFQNIAQEIHGQMIQERNAVYTDVQHLNIDIADTEIQRLSFKLIWTTCSMCNICYLDILLAINS